MKTYKQRLEERGLELPEPPTNDEIQFILRNHHIKGYAFHPRMFESDIAETKERIYLIS